ncbi:enoyl-CoA hydratase [Salibacterium salarium]|uniref:Enoyl-CoA hydratase n=1 Tax=Salibacterium salarium TaxID=284579 RepID=A0A3R9QNQ8_9BACI|nr:enoyl-CoA hydratase-related protein [Salibacterium salarium]RSL30015.1 enoyl-CoA hydratase [Salibacterium salarium]
MSESFINARTAGSIGFIELNRPESANALNRQMVKEIVNQAETFDADNAIRVIVIQGKGRAFAAGADIEEMKEETPLTFEMDDPFADWDRLTLIHKPLIASVHGFALGGGFELALHCDLIIAADNAEFGFPEVTLGVMPGAGGTQFLTRASGRRKALEWIWTGNRILAKTAYDYHIVNRLTAKELLDEETIRLAREIAERAPIAQRLIKEAVVHAEDVSLKDGMKLERKNFYLAFASEDQKEGMRAFSEKRKPFFKGV